MHKFYRVNEKVFIKPLKRAGIVKKIDKENREVTVSFYVEKNQLAQNVFKFNEIDKYSKPLEIKIKYFDETLSKIEKIKIGEWIDLRAAEDITMKQFEFKLIPLGVAMQLPKGYEANIIPRSSTYKNFGIIQANHFGVIDNSYCGDNDQWYFTAIALRDTEIKKNDRICQFRINKIMPKVKFIEVKELNNNSRGGFGSTGVK